MNKFIKLGSLLVFIFSSLNSSSQDSIDVTHYRFSISLNDSNNIIRGEAQVEGIRNIPASQLKLDLIQATAKTGMKVSEVTGSGVSGFQQLNNKLIINYAAKTNDSFKVLIKYEGVPEDGLIISKNKFGHRCFFSDNWPNRARNWIPCNDAPGDKASVEFLVTAPNHYQVISNGLLVEESNLPLNQKLTHWKEDVPLPTKIMVIGAADFSVGYVGEVNCVPVYSWVYPEDKDKGFLAYAVARDILEYFINYIGPFPYRKLANVQSKTIFGGMENASAIFYYENSVDGENAQDALMAHEIAHQWFGDMATEKKFAHVWLSEGFATYMTHIYLESRFGTDSLNKSMQKDRNEVYQFARGSKMTVVDSISEYMKLLSPNSYQKGGWILHMLRRQTGDSVFRSIIRTYYDRYKGKNANTQDFKAIAEELSGQNLDIFFKQWLYTPGVPQLKIGWRYNTTNKEVELNISPGENTIGYPLEIQFTAASGEKLLKNITVDGKNSLLRIPMAGPPASIVADPNTSSLARVVIEALK